MAEKLTISQLNKLGERLRKGHPNDDDLRALDMFRLSFASACDQVMLELNRLELEPVSRPAKTTSSIIAKLDRERSRLSKMQDIAGCRVVVDNIKQQDRAVNSLLAKFPGASKQDRRIKPSHGYRAVHVIVEFGEFHVEIQVRTSLQHVWASAIERIADGLDPKLKYGGGPEFIRAGLAKGSDLISRIEALERRYDIRRERGLKGPTLDAQESELSAIKSDLQQWFQAISME